MPLNFKDTEIETLIILPRHAVCLVSIEIIGMYFLSLVASTCFK